MNITVGMAAEAGMTVTEADTAAALGSGTALVLATPRMTALMEQAAWQAIAPGLDGGQSSVGVALSITHDAPTPVGMEVRARAEVTAVNGRKISFSVQAFDARGPIGQGVHDRVVIEEDKFVAKCYAKLEG